MTPKGRLWRVGQSWWILLTFTFLFNWVAFIYISSRTGIKRWAYWGIIYALPFMIIYLEIFEPSSLLYELNQLALLIGTVVSIVHAFAIRNEFLYLLEVKQIDVWMKRQENEIDFNEDIEEDLEEENIEGEDVKEKALDINVGLEEEIASLPGIGIILAKKAVQYRESKGRFDSIEEFCQALRLKEYAIKRVRPLITVSFPATSSTQANKPPGGRVVDM